MNVNTVRKYIHSLETKGLISTDPTTITGKDGRRRNGNLLFTIRPITEEYYEEQLRQPNSPA